MNTFTKLREALETGYTESSFAGLHPWLANEAVGALAVVEEMLSFADGHSASDLGIDNGWGVADCFFAAIDKTGEKAVELGYQPTLIRLSERVDLGEVPGPSMLTVGSEDSPNCAVVILEFREVNASGYGDLGTAQVWVCDIVVGIEEANQRAWQFKRAIDSLKAVMRKMDATNPERTRTKGAGRSF